MDHDLLHGQYMQTGINLMASDSSLIRVSATKSTLNFHMINLAPLSQGWLCGALVSSVLCSKAIAIYYSTTWIQTANSGLCKPPHLISKAAVKKLRYACEDRFSLILFIGFFVFFSCHQVAYKWWPDHGDRCQKNCKNVWYQVSQRKKKRT